MLLPIAAFFLITALFYGLAELFLRSRKSREAEVLAGGHLRPLIFGQLTHALAWVLPCSPTSKAKLTKNVRQAGHYHRWALEEFLSFRNALMLGWMFLVGTVIVALAPPDDNALTLKVLIAGVFGMILLYALPVLLLSSRAGARVQRIQFALPDALDMITMCTAGGLPLEQAFGQVSDAMRTTHGDLALELQILGRQMNAGSLDAAMVQFANRIDTPEIQSLTAVVSQTHMQGNSVAGAFQEFADGLRRGQRQRAEEQGNKASVKLLLPLVLCLAPPVYMLLLTPAVIELKRFVLEENQAGGILAPASLEFPDMESPNR